MNTSDIYDLSVLVIVLVAVINGYRKGLLNQVGALVSTITGIIVSFRFTPWLAVQLPGGSENFRSISALGILLPFATMVVWGVINLISRVINTLKLNSWNKQMGAVLGAVYGILLSMILTFILLIFSVPGSVPSSVPDAVQDLTISDDENDAPVPFAKSNEQSAAASNEQSFVMKSRFGPNLTMITLAIIDRLPHGNGAEEYKFYDNLREYLQKSANSIKKDNPDLPKEPVIPVPGESSDEEAPSLPIPVFSEQEEQ